MYYGMYAFVLFCLLALFYVYRHFNSPLRWVLGPSLACFTRLWYLNRVRLGHFHEENIALHQKYGPIVRLGPDLYSISTPDKAVYGFASRFPKGSWYDGWKHPSPDRWTLFPDRNIQRHAETRKRFQTMYSLSSIIGYETYVDDCVRILSKKLRNFALSGENIDIVHWFQCYAFDVIGHITYSQRFGFLDRGEDISGLMKALERSMVYSTLVGIYAWLHPYIFAIMEKMPGSGASGRAFIMKFVQDRIDVRNEQRKKIPSEISKSQHLQDKPQDFLDRLTDAHEEDPSRVTAYHIFMMGLSNIIAGSDTTAISLSSVLYHLFRNPRTLEKLRQEIDEIDQRRECKENAFSFKETQNMPYFQAVIKEALRLHPATGLPLWRVVPDGGATIAGQYFPAGVVVGLNSWVAHYSEETFGEDVKEFKPERWIEAARSEGEKQKRMEAFYMPFGLGSRTCLGRHISILEISKLIPWLVKHFDFELEEPDKAWETSNYWFVKPVRLCVGVKFRKGIL